MAEKKYVYSFEEAHKAHLGKDLLGGKGAGLAEMTAAGINIPAGFTITTAACTLYYQNGKKIPDYVWDDIVKHIHMVEKEVGNAINQLIMNTKETSRLAEEGKKKRPYVTAQTECITVELESTVSGADIEQKWDILRRKVADAQASLTSGAFKAEP